MSVFTYGKNTPWRAKFHHFPRRSSNCQVAAVLKFAGDCLIFGEEPKCQHRAQGLLLWACCWGRICFPCKWLPVAHTCSCLVKCIVQRDPKMWAVIERKYMDLFSYSNSKLKELIGIVTNHFCNTIYTIELVLVAENSFRSGRLVFLFKWTKRKRALLCLSRCFRTADIHMRLKTTACRI